MNHKWMLLVFVVSPVLALAQSGPSGGNPPPYQPVVSAPSTVDQYGGYGGYSGGSTVAGSAMNGMASVISAQGQRNLNNSAAAVNLTQAQKNEIENRQQWTNTYFDMRATNKKARDAERGPSPTMEQLVRIAQAGAPKPLNTNQLNPVSGGLNWPSALQQPGFDAQRQQIDELLATQARYGALNYAGQIKVRQTIDAMFDQLKAQVDQIPPMDYVACRSFLRSINYAATKTEM